MPRAPRPGYSVGRQQTSLSPGRERGGPGEARPGAAASAAGGQASCRPSAAPGRSLRPGHPGAGSAVGSGASGRREAGTRAPGPASLSPRARRRAPPRHRVPAGRERLHIRVPPRPGPEWRLVRDCEVLLGQDQAGGLGAVARSRKEREGTGSLSGPGAQGECACARPGPGRPNAPFPIGCVDEGLEVGLREVWGGCAPAAAPLR